MYEVDHRNNSHHRRRRLAWLGALAAISIVASIAILLMMDHLKTTASITQSPAITTKISYDVKTKHFDVSDFSIDLPTDWQVAPNSTGSYNPRRWQGKDGQVIEIFEDNIPLSFAVNRVQVVEPQVSRLQLNSSVSDNCADFTKALPGSPQQAVPAKWQGISFLCDESNQQPNVVGTSSSNGINTVPLKLSTGVIHNFFLTYTTRSTNPDYTAFYKALQSLRVP